MKRILILSILLTLSTLCARAEDLPAGGAAAPAAPPAEAPAAPAGGEPAGGAPSGGAPAGGEPAPSGRGRWQDDLDAHFDKKSDAPAGGGTPPPKPGEKKAEPAAPAAKPGEGDDLPQFKGNKDLREWAVTRHKEARRLEGELNSVSAKMKEIEAKIPKNDEQAKTQSENLKALQARVDEYENRIRFLDYQQSNEYKEKYEAPYQGAWKSAMRDLAEIETTSPGPEKDADGNPVNVTRPATEADLLELVQLPLGKATNLANQKFGHAASVILGHRKAIRDAAEKAREAVDEYKTKGGEIEKQRKNQEMEQLSTAKRLWTELNTAMSADDKFKSLWGRDETDKKANEELDKGFKMADQLFNESDSWPLEERVKLHVAARHRIAGFYKLRHTLGKKDETIKQLNETIERMKGSKPGKQNQGGGSAAGAEVGERKSWQEAMDEKLPG